MLAWNLADEGLPITCCFGSARWPRTIDHSCRTPFPQSRHLSDRCSSRPAVEPIHTTRPKRSYELYDANGRNQLVLTAYNLCPFKRGQGGHNGSRMSVWTRARVMPTRRTRRLFGYGGSSPRQIKDESTPAPVRRASRTMITPSNCLPFAL